jgi:galactarate dehydratase
MSVQPLTIRVHDKDNVAIVVNPGGLPGGTRLASGLLLTGQVPQGHKVALADMAPGAPIVRYGQVIGYAGEPIARGDWIHEGLVHLPALPDLAGLAMATEVPAPLPALEGYRFDGFRNADGSVGTKNVLGISTSVQCVAGVVDHAVARIKAEMLPRYPNVDDVVALTHAYGCGVAIGAPDAEIPIRALRNLARNPNLGGAAMVVGLGCEKLLPRRILPDDGSGLDADDGGIVLLQDERHQGFADMVGAIMAMAEARLVRLDRRRRVACPASDLVVGLQCGGSDAFSGVTANPAVGYAADLLVRAGATVLFSEVTEVRDAIHLLTPRAANEAVARALIREMDWYDRYLGAGGVDRSANPSPGNKAGGLANVVEKALGSIAKSGSCAIADVLSPGDRVRGPGLVYAATPASDFVCGTMQLASGITLEVFTTGRGTPYGLALAPVIKVATRSDLARQWHDLMDVDAGRIATGAATIEEVGWELFRLILEVASGRKKTWADHWGLHNALSVFNPAPVT